MFSGVNHITNAVSLVAPQRLACSLSTSSMLYPDIQSTSTPKSKINPYHFLGWLLFPPTYDIIPKSVTVILPSTFSTVYLSLLLTIFCSSGLLLLVVFNFWTVVNSACW